MSFTNALLAQKISDLIDYWSSFNTEYSDWLGGTVDGGPGADGKYPLTNWAGAESLIDSPAKLADNVSGYVGLASASETAAAASAAAAATSESNASTSASTATAQAVLADADRVAAELAESNALSSQTVATAQANLATDRVGYASEWANAAFETLVSAAAGGDLVDDYSALHWATVAEGFAGSVDSGLYGQLAQAETVTGNWTFSGQINPTATRHNFGPTTADIPTGFLDDADAALVTITNPSAAYAGDYGIHFTRNVDGNVGWSMWRDTSAGDLVINHEWNSASADIVFRRYTTDLMRIEGDGAVTIPLGDVTVTAGNINFDTTINGQKITGKGGAYIEMYNGSSGKIHLYPGFGTGGVSIDAGDLDMNGGAITDIGGNLDLTTNAITGNNGAYVKPYDGVTGDLLLVGSTIANTALGDIKLQVGVTTPVTVLEVRKVDGHVYVTNDLVATGAVTGSNLNVANWDTAYGWGDHTGLYSLAAHNHAGVYEPADATILKDADIGVTVQAYDATYVVDADIGVTVAAFSHSHSDYLPNSGVAVHTGDIDFSNILGDRITLWGTHDAAASYAIGIESGTMYFKADAQYRWYFDVNADLGVSDTMELTPNALYVNTQILAGNGYGSAGTPSFTSTQDANSGMYVKSSDTLGFSTGGVERVTIDVNGLTLVAAGADLILGNNSLTAENISSSAGAAPLKIGTGTGTPMVWGQYCALGRTYSAARTGLANNAYVDTDDAVSGQWRHLVTHGSYGHTILEMAAGAYYFYGKSESVTSGAIVTKNQYAQLDSGNGFKVATTANGNPGIGWSSLSSDMLHIDGKEVIDGNDTWLRINMNGDFTSGTYLPTAWHFANVMKRYNKGAYLFHQSTSYAASGVGGITFSTSAASGGSSGDIWFQYT